MHIECYWHKYSYRVLAHATRTSTRRSTDRNGNDRYTSNKRILPYEKSFWKASVTCQSYLYTEFIGLTSVVCSASTKCRVVNFNSIPRISLKTLRSMHLLIDTRTDTYSTGEISELPSERKSWNWDGPGEYSSEWHDPGLLTTAWKWTSTRNNQPWKALVLRGDQCASTALYAVTIVPSMP